jgi:hypothetical protein
VGPRGGLDAVEKGKIFHCRESNPGVQPVGIPTVFNISIPANQLSLTGVVWEVCLYMSSLPEYQEPESVASKWRTNYPPVIRYLLNASSAA